MKFTVRNFVLTATMEKTPERLCVTRTLGLATLGKTREERAGSA
jgi:hypothetical protein